MAVLVSRGQRPRWGTRLFVMGLLLVVASGLFGTLWLQVSRANSAELARIDTERQALPYLRALGGLTGELVQARTAATAGQTVPSVTAALVALSDVDAKVGADLSMTERTAELRAAVEKVRADGPTGQAARERYGDLIVQAGSLMQSVSAAAQLIADPRPEVRVLIDAVVIHTPTLVAAAGWVADVPPPAKPNASPSSDDVVQLALARHDLTTAYAGLTASVRLATETGASNGFVADATRQLDQLQLRLALLTTINQPTSTTANAASDVRQQTNLFITSALAEVESSLSQRVETLTQQQVIATVTVIAGIALTLVILWRMAVPGRAVSAEETGGDGADVASVSVRSPTVDARELLEMAELGHVGRGVRARPRDGADNA